MVHAAGVIPPRHDPPRERDCVCSMTSPQRRRSPSLARHRRGLASDPVPSGSEVSPSKRPPWSGFPAAAPPDRRKHPLRTRPADRRGLAQAPPSARRGLGSCPRPIRRHKPAGRVLELCNSDNNPDIPSSSIRLEENSFGRTA